MRALKLPRKPFILRLGSRCHLTSSFRDLRLFLELALRGFVSFYLRFLFFNSRAVFPSSTLPPPSPLPSSPVDPAQPQRSAAHRCSRCTYAIRRHVSAIFCAADESCRDRPMNASNIPAHRVSPSRGVFPERDTFWPGALLARSRDPCRLIALTRYLFATRANQVHAPAR